jgi:succinoglycan biosynthesis transport protein ExoP
VSVLHAEALSATTKGNRRRLLVFTITFAACLIGGMTWNLARPSLYRASARIELKVPGVPARSDASTGTPATSDFLSLAQTIDSGPTLEAVLRQLPPGSLAAAEPAEGVATLREMVDVHPIPGTDLLQLSATGRDPAVLAPIVDHLMAAFRDELQTRYEAENQAGLGALREELGRLEKAAAERREQLEAFRNRAGLVSTERDDGASLARHKGLTTALNTAVEKQAAAEARVGALEQAASAPGRAGRVREDPGLAAQEARLSALREELKEMERAYTPAFLAMDPRAIALRSRVSEVQRQIAQKRESSQQAALETAREDAEVARANVERLKVRLQAEQPSLRTFSSGFARSKHLEDDLAQVERARRDTIERLARIEASQRSRAPRMTVLEGPQAPTQPHSPDRWQDGLLVSAAAFVTGLLAMGFVELFNRVPAPRLAPTTTVVLPSPQQLAGRDPLLLHDTTGAPLPLGHAPARPLLGHAADERELRQDEAMALISAAQGAGRLACTLLLLGLDAEEAIAARTADIDPATGLLSVGGPSARQVLLPAWFPAAASASAGGDGWLLARALGEKWQRSDVDLAIACAAVDAGIASPSEVSVAVLRNTCIGWLVGQGVRFADLASMVGRFGPDTVASFGDRAQRSSRRPAGEIDRVMPAVREAPLDAPPSQAA